MKVTQEKLPASQVGLEIEITPEMSKSVYERVLRDFTKSMNIPGFRKGKVPRQVLIQRIGITQLKAAALEELIDEGLKKAVEQEKIDALGNYQLRSAFEDLVSAYEPGQSITFSAAVDVPPEVTLKHYTNLTIQAEAIKPDPERIRTVLADYQKRVSTLVPVEDRPAQANDMVVIDFKGVVPTEDPDAEPEEVPGAQGEDFQLELTEGRFIPGFIEGVIGMSLEETKEVPLTFPEDYFNESLSGQDVVFTITLKEIKERELPELDDDFAKEVSEFETIAELRESLEKQFQEEADQKTRTNKEEAILDELLNYLEVDLPETLIDREQTYMLNQTAMQLQNQGYDINRVFTKETIPELKRSARPDAIKRIQRTLALGEVAKQESIEVGAEELSAKLNEVLRELAEQEMDRNIDRGRLQEVVKEDLLKEKIIDWLLEHSTVELVPEGTLKSDEAEMGEEGDRPEAANTTTALEVSASEATVDVTASPVEEAPLAEAPVETAIAPETEVATPDVAATEAISNPADTAAESTSTAKPRKASKSKPAKNDAPSVEEDA